MAIPVSRKWVRLFLLVSGSILAIGVSGCRKDPPIPEVVEALNNTEEPDWVSRDKNRPNPVAVVFVHGIFGTTRGTWTNKDNKTFFDLIKKDPDVGSKVDIYAFGYTSEMFKEGSLDIYSAADKLDHYLTKDKVWNYNTVVFVAHSMGGLVTMQLLLNKRQRLSQVPLVVFYATPQEGSTLASIGKLFLPNPALSQMIPDDPGGFIVGLDNNWAHMVDDVNNRKIKPRMVCAHETKSVYGLPVVKKFSATRFCDGARNGIGKASHISITKPESERDQAVIILANALADVLTGDRGPRLDLVGFNKVGDEWVYDQGYFNTPSSGAILKNDSTFPVAYYLGKTQPVSSNLMIWPSDNPRTIQPKSTQELGFILMTSGQVANEYRFTVDSGIGDRKNVIVRIPLDGQAQKEARERQERMLLKLSEDLQDPDIQAVLSKLTPDGQQKHFIELAGKHIDGIGEVDSPEYKTSHALLLADALSATLWSPLAAEVMNDLKKEAPDVADTPAFQSLSVTIASRSGDQQLRSELKNQGFPVSEGWLDRNLDRSKFEMAGAATWPSSVNQLSDDLKMYEGLRQYGLVLEAEGLLNKGRTIDASELYRKMIEVNPTPEMRKRSSDLEIKMARIESQRNET